MLLSGKLNAHLEEIDRQAKEMLSQLVRQMADAEGITEQLKARDQMAWVSAMNNIRRTSSTLFRSSTKSEYVELIKTWYFFSIVEPHSNLSQS